MNYHYRDKAGQEIGPLTLDALAKLRFAGVLDGDTPVRVADSADWKPCREIIAAPSHSPQSETATAPAAKSPLSPVLIILIVVGALAYGGMTLYKSIAAKTSLAYAFSLDGKGLSNFQTPQVKVDGQSSWSGNKIKPGRHQISVQLESAEPFEQRFWVLYGEKNLGTLPLESSKGSLGVTVNPSPATVTLKRLDEIVRQGDAPLKIDKLPVGDYSIVIHRGDYEETHSVTIQRQRLTDTKIELNLGSVSLASDPADAEYDLSGNGRHWQGKLPMRLDDVPVGNYSLLTRRKGWELSAGVLVSRGGITTNRTEFQYGSISVASEPTGLAISTNGVEIAKTPTVLHELKPGQYTLTATDGENDLSAEITVGPKEEVKHTFVFHYGAAQLASTPPGAAVLRKGKEIGKTPMTLSRIPAGETVLALSLAGYAPTNLTVYVTAAATTNLQIKLTSERYLEARQRAQTAFDSGQFSESERLSTSALVVEPNDPSAISLRDKAKAARIDSDNRAVQVKDEARRKDFAEQAAQKRKQFENALSQDGASEYFEIHTREFPYSFETVWQAATSILRQKDKGCEVNPAAGFLRQRSLSQPGKGIAGFLGNVLGPGDYRAHWMLITPVDRDITRMELKLFNYESADSPNAYVQMKTQQGQPYKLVQSGIFTFGVVLDKELVRRKAGEFFDEVGKAVRPTGAAPAAQNGSVKKPSIPESQKPDSIDQATPDGRRVLEKVIAAHGGKERFRRVVGNKTVSEGDLYSDGVTKVKYSVITEYRKPSYLRQEYVIDRIGGRESQVTEVNGLTVASTLNGRAVPLDEVSRQEWINRARESRTLLEELEDPKSAVTLLPPEVENSNMVRVRSTSPDGAETIRYIDKSSWLIVKSEGSSVLNSKRVKVVTEFSDFREFDGINVATHEVVYYDNVKKADLRRTQCHYSFAGPE